MAKRDIVVIGASAGGVFALQELAATLPADCKATFFVVQHLSANTPSYLPQILTRSGPLKARHPRDGETIVPGTIYIAPPDHHLLIEDSHILVKRGPKENRFRPAIDALFRSAAYTFGTRVIGVVLTGLLDDGTSGMWTIKRFGGLTIVQEPLEAMYASMPQSVMEYVDVDYIASVADIGPLICELTSQSVQDETPVSGEEYKRIGKEILVAAENKGFDLRIQELGAPSTLTCPECHGALVSIREGNFERFRCHTGHGFSADDLLAELSKSTEETLWITVRGLQEAVMILERSSSYFRDNGNPAAAQQLEQKIAHIQQQISTLRELVFDEGLNLKLSNPEQSLPSLGSAPRTDQPA